MAVAFCPKRIKYFCQKALKTLLLLVAVLLQGKKTTSKPPFSCINQDVSDADLRSLRICPSASRYQKAMPDMKDHKTRGICRVLLEKEENSVNTNSTVTLICYELAVTSMVTYLHEDIKKGSAFSVRRHIKSLS